MFNVHAASNAPVEQASASAPTPSRLAPARQRAIDFSGQFNKPSHRLWALIHAASERHGVRIDCMENQPSNLGLEAMIELLGSADMQNLDKVDCYLVRQYLGLGIARCWVRHHVTLDQAIQVNIKGRPVLVTGLGLSRAFNAAFGGAGQFAEGVQKF
ncbi:MAG TPA: hypothetical protein VFV39_11565, partial [Limnobacter sp.]|nr:hypothetical protein [Limnobacter sp.]